MFTGLETILHVNVATMPSKFDPDDVGANASLSRLEWIGQPGPAITPTTGVPNSFSSPGKMLWFLSVFVGSQSASANIAHVLKSSLARQSVKHKPMAIMLS